MERNPNELKELKKEGYTNVVDLAGGNQGNRYREAYQLAVKNSSLQGKGGVGMKEAKEEVEVEGKDAKDEKE